MPAVLDALELQREKQQLIGEMQTALAEDNGEKAQKISGRVEYIEDLITQAIEADAEDKKNAGDPVQVTPQALGTIDKPRRPKNLGEVLLGARAEFKGLPKPADPIVSKTFSVVDEYEYQGGLDPLPERKETDETIPVSFLQPAGFLASLPKATTSANILEYFVMDEGNALKAEIWERGPKSPKHEQSLAWTQTHTKLQYVAHWIPVLLPALHDWGQLNAVINTELRQGYERAIDDLACNGTANYTEGIQGILNNPNIQTFTQMSDENIIDSIRRMMYKSMSVTGMAPNAICINPIVKVALDLLKDANQRYLELSFAGRLWNLPVYEDYYLGTEEDPAVIVYNTSAATWYTNETMTIRTGTINEQFIENSVSILCEGSHGLMVRHPKSFVKLGVDIEQFSASLGIQIQTPGAIKVPDNKAKA